MRARSKVIALVAAASSLFGCATEVARPPTAPLDLDRPGAAIPGDLDVAVRLDLTAARRLFGEDFVSALALDITDPDDRGTADLVHAALVRADTAWVAFRPGLAPKSTDNVLVLRGDFGDLDARDASAAWSPPSDLGGGMRVYSRHAPKRRSAPARIYARGDDCLVFVSTAEVDAAERTIERRITDDHVDPKDHGLVSVAARTPPVARLLTPRYPAVAEALEGGSTLEGNATADERGIAVDVSARFVTGPDAERARDRLKVLASVLRHARGPFALLAGAAQIDSMGADLVVRVRLDPKASAMVVDCFNGKERCAGP